MRPVLPGPENPVHFLRLGIIAANRFRRLCREPRFAAYKKQSVRSAQRPEINRPQRFRFQQIDNRERVVRAATIVRYLGDRAVCGSNYLVRIFADGRLSKDLQSAGIYNCQRSVTLGQNQQGFSTAVIGCIRCRCNKQHNQRARNGSHEHELEHIRGARCHPLAASAIKQETKERQRSADDAQVQRQHYCQCDI